MGFGDDEQRVWQCMCGAEFKTPQERKAHDDCRFYAKKLFVHDSQGYRKAMWHDVMNEFEDMIVRKHEFLESTRYGRKK